MSYQPQHYVLRVGTWDTDVAYNTTFGSRSGAGCIEFKNTTPASDPEWGYDAFIDVAGGNPYALAASVYGTSTAYDVVLRAEWFDEDQTQLTGGDAYTDAHNGVLYAASEWVEIGSVFNAPADARYAKFYISKDATSAWTLYVDEITFRKMPFAFHAYLSTDQLVSASTVTKVEFDAETYDYGSWFDTSYNWAVTPASGIYTFTVQVMINTLYANDQVELYLSGGESGESGRAQAMGSPTVTRFLIVAATVTRWFDKGEAVNVKIHHNSAYGSRYVDGTVNTTWFSGQRVE